ncbi:Ig-like domain-containing protein [Ruminococcus bovis]|uniref:Ig-like domain-containing protein n=1 Tax=Ruminococcus bovis TaxID=2564099 RepID=A0A4P8XXY0_9FIRM|nr:Ig-like domain-containing protein [Ruminococcus bovis]
MKFNVIVAPSNANNKGIIYSSSNKKVATVTSSGLIKGIKEGTAIIIARAKDSSKKAVKLIVKVKKPPINFYTKISKDEFNEPKNIKTYVDALNKYFESCGAVINPNMVGSSQWCVVTTTTFNNNISIYDRYVSTIGMWTWRRSQDEVDNGFEWKNLKPGKSLENFLQLLDDYSFYNSGKYNPKKILDSNWNGWKQFCQYDNTDDIVNIYVYPVKAQDMNAYTVYMYWGTNAGLKLKGIPLVKE